MPIYAQSSKESLSAAQANPCSQWYRREADPLETGGCLAFQRLNQSLFVPLLRPGFAIRPEDKLYAIGSCFARGVELAMAQRGFAVESLSRAFDEEPLRNERMRALGFTNRYSTASILDELTWALDPEASFPERSLIRLDDDHWVDPHTNPTLAFVDLERTLERRRKLMDLARRVKSCRVVVLTLGLVEVWLDAETGHYINMTPGREMRLAAGPGRYAFHALNFEENRKNLERIYRLLVAHGHPDVHVVVTVSPVALQTTFTGRDVVIANTYSKCTLRAAAEEFAAANSRVDYFPSYEIVMNSDRGVAWIEDKRHVQGGMVQHIIDLFQGAYLKGADQAG
ncbi:MAG: GSCFA domain-containing protein [bacterium]